MNKHKDFFTRTAKTLVTSVKSLLGRPIVNRSFHTFWQGFLVTFALGIPLVVAAVHARGIDGGEAALISLAVGSAMAGLSAVKTYLKQYLAS
jgi:hypothetical protein